MIRNIILSFGQTKVWELVLLVIIATLTVASAGVSSRANKLNPSKAEKVITVFATVYWIVVSAVVMSRLLCGISATAGVVSTMEQQRDRGVEVFWRIVITGAATLLYYPILLWVGRAGYFCYAYSEKRQKIKKESLS